MRRIGKDTITIRRAPLVTDAHNNSVDDWPNAVNHDQGGCYVEEGDTSENLVNRDELETAWIVFAPPSTDVLFTDHVVWQGVEYQVKGQPKFPHSFSGKIDYCSIDLVKWAG